ncbi:ABC transporter substrate-binding protein [Acetohalobium arabaticum]|uniref:Substrate-binding region of ABC-type glycine betaine transport system n=1 Tax=Acetohalobium arabaticum (strain ATCC 49924 / DSM 5501 / Z-7288) TaxID=574087 RepID=D9QQE1_ACEAZ|nr:ABC transporter substrate-binding protein [Acetohalobium arabaticum]ADL12732.1 Substrate-binding region of ABC-type glycine betaine transport system [Acetohalobium arabaticum DSM 5501]
MKKLVVNLIILMMLVTIFAAPVAASNPEEPIVFGEADWPGIWGKDAVVEHILENIGYEVEIKTVKNVIIYNRMVDKEIDVFLGSWMPSDKPTRDELKGQFKIVKTNLDEGLYTLGVPKYVWEAGVRSFTDLDKYAEKFDHKIYAGPIGWKFTKAMKKAIKNDIYGLGDWKLVNSSQTAMIANMKRAVKKGDWIATLAWKPHWMNYVMDIKYLKDPKNIWVNAESWVDTITRVGFKQDRPQVHKFLTQFKTTTDMSNEWIYYIGYKDQEPERVAQRWVKNNLDVVKDWLKGVKAKNGKQAFEVLKNKVNN